MKRWKFLGLMFLLALCAGHLASFLIPLILLVAIPTVIITMHLKKENKNEV